MKIYHNPRCSKSRQTLALIEEAGVQVEVILYLEDPPTAVVLEEILDSLEMEPADLMRKGEAVYAELGLTGRELDRAEAIEIMVSHPVLIERPIVVKAGQAVIGRPPENVQQLL
ncbi:MAG: arsenate reductase (glutaredoxin) [Pirellulaceae bacterium]